MASRKRQRSLLESLRNSALKTGTRPQRATRDARRRNLLEKLEQRQLLAGPQLIGIQPNEGALIIDGTVREVSPRLLTFRFDEDQSISSATTDAIRITRAGEDGALGTADDQVVSLPDGSVVVNSEASNEVLVRFPNALPDDRYRIEVFGFDDPGRGIVGLRNTAADGSPGDLLVPSEAGARKEQVDFELRLGALVEAVVPQPVVRLADGSLEQRRDQVVVYFNEDELFAENDASGNPTLRSVENPRFYQLLYTRDTVRTTDDDLYLPTNVRYDAASHTATLTFQDDISNLAGAANVTAGPASISGGTFRLRVGTAVDDRAELIIQPTNVAVVASVTSDLLTRGAASVTFVSRVAGEAGSGASVRFERTGTATTTVRVENDREVVISLASGAEVSDVRDAMLASPEANALLEVRISGDPGAAVGEGIEFLPALEVVAVGDTFETAFDVGTFGESTATLTSLIVSEQIDPQPYLLELLGGNDDPGHRQLDDSAGSGLRQHISHFLTPDITAGITTIPYNFQTVYGTTNTGADATNSITPGQKERVREALALYAAEIGVQFTETADQGITFAVGDLSNLRGGNVLVTPGFGLGIRIDPTFATSAVVLNSQIPFSNQYGERFFRTALLGIGDVLGLEQAGELPMSTLSTRTIEFLTGTIDQNLTNLDRDLLLPAGPFPGTDTELMAARPLEPIFPGDHDILHAKYLYNPDSIDIDLYRFEVDLGDGDKVGLLTAETFAERLSDSSLLDTTLTLYQQQQATVTTDFEVGTDLSVEFEAVRPALLGNRTQIEFAQVDRIGGSTAVEVVPTSENSFRVEIPRQSLSTGLPVVTVGSILDAINNDPFASSLVTGRIVKGDAGMDVGGLSLDFNPLMLSGGDLIELSRNDDYFSEDSRIRATLGNGVYYVGVAASGNDLYDPTIPGSGFGGRSQGKYDLQFVFEAQVDEVDVIRDLDSGRAGVPGVALDGDGDGVPGGAYNYWFQSRPLQRQVEFSAGGDGITPLSTIRIEGGQGVERVYQFVPQGSTGDPRFTSVIYRTDDSAAVLAIKLRQAINTNTGSTGVSAASSNGILTLSNEREIDLSPGFVGAEVHGKTIFVDKLAGPNADGTTARPFNNISSSDVANAFDAAEPGDIVRIVGNGGSDQTLATEADNFAYEFGFAETAGQILEDGAAMEVPQGVTTMIDAGAVFRFRNSRISVGSSDLLVDRSDGALQVLGTPRLLDVNGNVTSEDGSVIFTSTRDRSAGQALPANSPPAAPGDWGGLVFRSDFDDAQGRLNLEDEGIFLQYVNHADIRFGGGGNVKVGGFQQIVNPIQIIDTRPTITFNRISRSAGAAMSAAPNSFEETSYQAPRYQQAGAFTSDYDRVGPDIHFNELIQNSFNALFVRVDTLLGSEPRELTLAGRFDDTDVVHVLAENLKLAGTPGGAITDGIQPAVDLINAASRDGGTLTPGDYAYRITFVDANGFESLPSDASSTFTVANGDNAILLSNLPPAAEGYQTRRVYRASLGGPHPGEFRLVREIDASSSTFFDDGQTTEGVLDLTRNGTRGRLDASLVFDPGLVTKLIGSRLELGVGTQVLAEGLPGQEVVFTSISDDRYGIGGTFDTNNNGNPAGDAKPGDWGGIYVGPTAHLSLDNGVVAYGGGLTRIEGSFKAFNPIELQQGTGRITDTVFSDNANGQGGQGPTGRFGRLANTPATIFVRGSQPTVVNNQFINNGGSVIDIDANSMVADLRPDIGRQTGGIERLSTLDDNSGPLVRRNRYDNNDINGMEIRGATLTVESIWDDTDIVHVVYDPIVVDNMHSAGGLRLESRPDESLVVKFSGGATPYAAEPGTGLTAKGTPTDIRDRIGGTLHIIGQPGFPVVLTSLKDDTVGAGVKPDGSRQTDTNNDDLDSRPEPNDWRGILLDEYSNDRNVETVLELESSVVEARGTNGTVGTAQVLGDLAPNFYSTDEYLRLGFTVDGYLASPSDVDVYNFTGEAGTVVWFDIDKTTHSLDTVIELLDSDGNLLARSNNSTGEVTDPSGIVIRSPLVEGRVGPLARGDEAFHRLGVEGQYKDYGTTNPRDAGFRVALPGVTGSRSAYSFRIRSASVQPDDVGGGTTHGAYTVQLRLREDQEFGGSVVRFADIRYANHGVHMRGVMQNSPLLGDAQENEEVDDFRSSNDSLVFDQDRTGNRPQYLGNLLETDDVSLTVGGNLFSSGDVDFYKFDIDYEDLPGEFNPLQHFSTVFDVDYADGLARPDTSLAVFWDPDGEVDQNFNRERARLVLWSEDGNIGEDQTSPLGPDPAELFERGSLGSGDPFIGPVSVPATGVYYVAVVSDSRAPSELLNNPTVRRDPLPSVARIADDQIDTTGAHTAEPPAVPVLIPRTGLPADWQIGNQRSANGGHGDPQYFDNTNTGLTNPGPTIVNEFERNDPQLSRAQNLEFYDWNLSYDGDVGDTSRNTSLLYPWIKVRGTGDGTIDAYSFTVPADGKVIIDVDEVSNGFTQEDDESPFLPADLRLVVVDSAGTIVGTDDSSPASFGAGGSDSSRDPFLELDLTAGTYTFALGLDDLSFSDGAFTGEGVTDQTLYTVNVSVEGHSFRPNFGANQALQFVPATTAPSTFETNAFNLGNYTAQDQPYLYFNYYLAETAFTSLEVQAVTDSGTFALPFAFQQNYFGSFRQARISLDPVVGQDNIRLQFVAQSNRVASPASPPLTLDDFVIGFAERGERISNASPGQDGFSFTGSSSSILQGEYQLEIRQGASYSTSQNATPQQVLTETFDTNARLAPESVTLIAPAGRDLRDGDFFELSDGATTVRFEFNSTGGVSLGSLPVPFTASDTDYEVAQAIRNAINGSTVQAVLNIEASTSGGIDNGPSRDNRIDLFGPVEADFNAVQPTPLVVTAQNDPVQLADAVSGGGIARLGGETASGGAGLGQFVDGAYSINLDRGVILSTGRAADAAGPNLSETTSGTASGSGDADLDAATGIASVDSSSFAFDFQLAGSSPSHVYLQAVFASEEYVGDATAPEDQVAVLITDLDFGGTVNLALTPSSDPVNSTSIAPGSSLYNDNSPSRGGKQLNEFGLDGYSQVLTFSTENTDSGSMMLQPGRRYSIKFVVGDGESDAIDSALFLGAESFSTTAPADVNRAADPATGRVTFDARVQNSFGDRNVARTQTQIIIDSSTISHSHVYGIWSEPARRKIDFTDARYDNPLFGSQTFVNDYIQTARLGNTGMGAVRNLPTLNDSVIGGLAPGPYIVNNIIDDAQLAGVNIQGELRPWVIDPDSSILDPDSVAVPAGTCVVHHIGDCVVDGALLTIDAGRTRVVFEFEDIQSGPGGGGDGVRDGHIPIYYRPEAGTQKNRRNYGYNKHELLLSIREAILASPLVQNDMVQLVDPVIANNVVTSSPIDRIRNDFNFFNRFTTYQEPALYLYGATNVYMTAGIPVATYQAPIHEGVQPFARLVNNTIVGRDGTLSTAAGSATDEPNDTIATAVETQMGVSHTPDLYTTSGTIGDNQLLDADQDVDFFKVELNVGDRLRVNVDTDGSVDTVLRLFNSSGQVVTFYDAQNNPLTVSNNAAAPGETVGVDPYIDYTATGKDSYYVAISASGNDQYDSLSLGQRLPGSGTGDYDLSIEVLAPRQFVIDAQAGSAYSDGDQFTIYQVPDLPAGKQAPVAAGANAVVFEFVSGTGGSSAGTIPINFDADYTPADMALAIAGAINGFVNNPRLPNHEETDLPDGRSGPIDRVTAQVLGGIAADDQFLENFTLRPHHAGSNATAPENIGSDSRNGYGFDDVDTGRLSVTSSGEGETERYVIVKRAAHIDPNGSIRLDPVPGRNNDQLIPETGVLATQGASPTLLNNVIINTNGAVVNEETRFNGFGPNRGTDRHPKKGEVVVGGSIFQATESENLLFRTIPRFFTRDIGIEAGPTNTNNPSDDFNVVLNVGADSLVNPLGGDFLPIGGSLVIDSAIDSLAERSAFATLKQSLGIAVSPILAPNRDNSGQLRADDPDTQTPPGLGANVFKDRGALDLADFVGPVATLDVPKDNDAEGVDTDPAVSFLQLSDGSYSQFRIQLTDAGDASDPFPGSGIDDDTVVGPDIPGLRKEGAAVTVFENGRLLTEGIDYRFAYDATKNQIRLTPLAGIWRNDRSYRIQLNNEDRFVVIAPSAATINDGDQLTITDNNGGVISLEFEAGYEVELPEILTLIVPPAGTGAGGISDSDRFVIDDGTNAPVTFEFDLATENNILPGSVRVPYNLSDSPADLAAAVATAISSQTGLNVDVTVQGSEVLIGAESGASVDAFDSGLLQTGKTLALQPPAAGAGPGGIQDGETFTINDGTRTVTFEFNSTGGVQAGNVAVSVAGATQAVTVSQAIQQAIAGTNLNASPVLVGDRLLLGLPAGASATAGAGQLRVVGLSQTLTDGTTLTFTPTDGGDDVVFELNRTDTANNDGVAPGSVAVDYTRNTTADQLAQRIAAAIRAENIAGVTPSVVEAIGNGVVAIGGDPGLGLTATGSSGLVVTGEPGVADFSNLQIFGSLELILPQLGGPSITPGSQFALANADGSQTVTFEFTESGVANDPNAVPITYNVNDSVDVVVAATVAAINGTSLGINAATDPARPQVVLLGQIDDAQVQTLNSGFSTRRGTVNDGDYITISQGSESRTFEFDLAVSGGGLTQPGAVPVTFQAGSSADVVASALAAAIRNNRGQLRLDPVANGDQVLLNDVPGTNVNVFNAPTLLLSGVPGRATPILVNRSFSSVQIKEALIDAINRINDNVRPGDPPFTDVRAVDRGGDTLFVENAQSIGPEVQNYFLQSIADEAGRDLKPNRADNTTQFTILMNEISLDFGDAPDPVSGVRGRYPTLFDVDGARHVIGLGPVLGSRVDGDVDGQPTTLADGDDTSIDVVGSTGSSFVVTQQSGSVTVAVTAGVDGDTLTLDTGTARATFEFDTDGIFEEDNFAVAVQPGETMGEALLRAFEESPLRPAELVAGSDSLQVIVDDEDGVSFPDGVAFPGVQDPVAVFNNSPGFRTPITVTVTGTGILDAWVDFNGDGDWLDPGEKIIGRGIDTFDADGNLVSPLFVDDGQGLTRTFSIAVPTTTAAPLGPLTTYARFRLSAEGDLAPTGLALSGEVEDYLVRVLPGQPPAVPVGYQLTYDALEDTRLDAFDADGSTPPDNNNGILAGIVDPDGDPIAVYREDVGPRRLENAAGNGGDLVLNSDGTFSFTPDPDFAGQLSFTARVTDVRGMGREGEQLVSPNRVNVVLNVQSVNDPPQLVGAGPNFTLNEDEVRVFTAAELTDGVFSPGPANESDQALIIKTVGYDNNGTFVPFASAQGGSLQILDDGTSVRYTPPADYNGSTPDTFVYTVEDVPTGAGEVPELGNAPATATITLNAVNDPPTAVDDVYAATEDDPDGLKIPIDGTNGILDNDSAGPADEDQTLNLVLTDFPMMTARGGSVRYVAASGSEPAHLLYMPAANFSGADQFTYRVSDSDGAIGSATVVINVGGANDPAQFIGINGQVGEDSITRNEAGATPVVVTYDLNTWFSDPEGDPLSFVVTTSDADVVTAEVSGSQLRLTYPPYGFGTATLTVTADNLPAGTAPSTQVTIPVTVNNVPNPPRLIGTLNPLSGQEDTDVVADLSTVFEDPDRTQLTYRVVSPASFANSPLIESIEFDGDQMTIKLRQDANGSATVTIGATDDVNNPAREVTDTFTLNIAPVQDAPTGVADFYNVALGARLSVLDPQQGVLANDFDPDGDDFNLELVSGPSRGTVDLRADGTFVYQNTDGEIGDTDVFTYRLLDATGASDPISVTINLGRSSYQNPSPNTMEQLDNGTLVNTDVSADGFLAPNDLLLVINQLNRTGSISVSELNTPPPPYVDVDGDGQVLPKDAAIVLNALNRQSRQRNASPQGEAAQGEAVAGTTVSYAAIDPVNLPQSNRVVSGPQRTERVQGERAQGERVQSENAAADGSSNWQAGFVAVDNRVESAVDQLVAGLRSGGETDRQEAATDSALSELLDEISVDLP
ncbi:tandem-95 repeat protein [Roseimaritima sediminicola]|uniref:tandem-95 repeat protein n=1 Tax=Roseimaritima sediminicola TaxID=2662066 RepID=UPI001298410F|nr:Ig-like domain-containing protein [Roseimaritima sediminicola]